MLSDEEIKAIEILKLRLENASLYVRGNNEVFYNALGIVLKLIEKQQKEMEELKEYKHDAELTKVACCTAQNCEALNNCIKLERELQNADKKWEDKIKAILEEYKYAEIGDSEKIIEFYKKIQSLLEKE